MERNKSMSSIPPQAGIGSQPIALVSQLRQQVPQMQHIDEMFAWMAHALMTQWQIPLIQFWAAQAHSTGQPQAELRAVASRNAALPSSLHTNAQVTDAVKRILGAKQGFFPRPTDGIFSRSYVEHFARYNISYWGGYFISDNVLLPPKKDAEPEKVATPLNMVIALFLQNPPQDKLGRAMDYIFQHSFRVAVDKGLFNPQAAPRKEVHTETLQRQTTTALDLSSFVPHRTQNIEEIQTGNPFAYATIIPDRKARQIYSLINGQRNVATLARMANLDVKEVEEALRLLIQQGKISLQDGEETK